MNEKIILETPKGFRDFPPEEKILRDKVINEIKTVFENYGYSPLETPTVEKLEILEAKFGAGEGSDAVSEIYRFKDQGDRDLGLRYEFTFALARFVGQNPQTRLPFKRYQIGPVFRDGPIKTGRYREFYQCDVDVVGVEDVSADAEIISLIDFVFKKLDLEIEIEVNDRRLLEDILNFYNIEKEKQKSVIISVDKLNKIGSLGVKNELLEKNVAEKTIDALLKTIDVSGNNQEKLETIGKTLGEDKESIISLKKLLNYLEYYNVSFNFEVSLARGLGYYTGPIFEVFLKDKSKVSSSVAGGGRWDEMIGKYLRTDKKYPATGVAFGLEPIMEIIKEKKGLLKKTTADLFIISIDDDCLKEAIKITQKIREFGVNTSLDLLKRSIGKNIDYADKIGITYVGFLGPDEILENKIKIKNIKTGKEIKVLIDDVLNSLNF